MLMMFKDKVVIVSGIGAGLGVELARIAAKEGAKVAIGARTQAFLEQSAKEISDAGGEVIWRRTDISENEDCKALAKAAVDKWGRIDALVNNAAKMEPFTSFEEADFEGWRAIANVNLFGSLQMAQACLPAMKKQGKGYIVNVTSMAHRKPLPNQGGYASSKSGLEGATRHMALELGKYGIRVNTARMGWMDGPPVTGFLSKMAEDTGVDLKTIQAPIVQNIPLGMIPDDADCARAVLFLCTAWADAVSGAILDVNGGEYMPS
jgi:NAD(P)-dependent dehydrogenase (short-subunit alcohol dehydrogenase family)